MAYSFPPGCYKIVMITTLATTLLLVVSSNISSAFPVKDETTYFPQRAFDIVKDYVNKAINKEKRMGASLLRLHFHDCFVNGCDGSVLLDNTTATNGEKFSVANLNSARGFDVINNIKSALENENFRVSCADILAVAARDAVVSLGRGKGPNWGVQTGRFDSFSASLTDANNGIPPPNSTIKDLIRRFKSLGLSTTDLVALSGAHTIGQAQCRTFRGRIYNTSSIDRGFAKQKQDKCPSVAGQGDNNLAPLDLDTPTDFDNSYYKYLVNQKGLLNSDQELYSGGDTDSAKTVQDYVNNPFQFNADFAAAMIKMGNIGLLEGTKGEKRKDCRKRNT